MQNTIQPVQETVTPVEVEVPIVEREKQPIPNRSDAQYLSGMNDGTFNTVENTSNDNSYFRIYDIKGDTAKIEYFGNDSMGLARRAVTGKGITIKHGGYKTGQFVNTVKPGTVKKGSDGS